jgi:hypothetical protein
MNALTVDGALNDVPSVDVPRIHPDRGFIVKERSVVAVLVLTLITFGIYGIYWSIATKREMVDQGADIPTGWLIIVPIANIWWQWKWSGGVEHVTRGKLTQVISFILIVLLSWIGMAIIQSTFNEAARSGAAMVPRARAVG